MTYYIENERLKVGVKSAGAELTSVYDKKNNKELLWQGNPDIWYGQSPILFPIIGRLLDDKYYVDGKEFSMPKHGLFRKREAELVSSEKTKIVFVEHEDDETLAKYPYKFDIFITFNIKGDTLNVSHRVVNKNDKRMYFSLGAHPAFNCEIGDILEFNQNENLDTVSIDADSIRINETTPVLRDEKDIVITEHIFDGDALILSGMKSDTITLKHKSSDDTVKFKFGACPYLGIWAKPGAPYVCIEPWWGVNDSRDRKKDISEKDGIQYLDAGKEFEYCWKASF